jgi:hypothetical protein
MPVAFGGRSPSVMPAASSPWPPSGRWCTCLCLAGAGAAGPGPIWRQSCDRPGEQQFCQLPGQGGEQQPSQPGRRQNVYRAHQDNRGPGVPGREQDLNEIVISENQYPVLSAGPLQDHHVISARQAYLTYVDSIVPSSLQMSGYPVGNILIQQKPSCRAGDRQVILTHRERGKGGRLLNVGSFDEREVGLDLLQRPARTHQAQQMLHRETVPVLAGSSRIQSLKTTVEPRSNDLGYDHQACRS